MWKTHGLAPHRWRRFKLSNDPDFANGDGKHHAGDADRLGRHGAK
jgi:hypothetical protein